MSERPDVRYIRELLAVLVERVTQVTQMGQAVAFDFYQPEIEAIIAYIRELEQRPDEQGELSDLLARAWTIGSRNTMTLMAKREISEPEKAYYVAEALLAEWRAQRGGEHG